MRRSQILSIGAAAALIGSNAFANGSLTAPIVYYNGRQALNWIGPDSVFTAPYGGVIGSPVYTITPGTQLESGSRFTIALSGGLLFYSEPNLTPSSTTALNLVAGGPGSAFLTYQVTGAVVPAGTTILLSHFQFSAAPPLASEFPGDPLLMTFQATSNVNPANNDLVPLAVPAFGTVPGSYLYTQGNPGLAIDLTASPPGTQFVPDDISVAGSGFALVFGVRTQTTVGGAPVFQPTGPLNALDAGETTSVLVKGRFSGIKTAYALALSVAYPPPCSDSVPAGALTATVTSNSLTFADVLVDSSYEVCLIPDRKTLMVENQNPLTVTYGPGSADDFYVAPGQGVGNAITYTGGTVQTVSKFYTGSDSGYASLLRVNNAGTAPATVIAEFQPWSGGALLTGTLGTLLAGSGTTFTLAQVEAAVPGLSLANSGQRASLTVVGVGADTNVDASVILVVPGGGINNVD